MTSSWFFSYPTLSLILCFWQAASTVMSAFNFLVLTIRKLVVSTHSVCSNAQKLSILPTWFMDTFYVILTINSDFYPNNISRVSSIIENRRFFVSGYRISNKFWWIPRFRGFINGEAQNWFVARFLDQGMQGTYWQVGPGESGQLLTRTVEMQLQVAKGIRINGPCIELETGGSNQWICGQAIAQWRYFAAAEDKSRSKAPLTVNAKYNIPNYSLSPKDVQFRIFKFSNEASPLCFSMFKNIRNLTV